MDIPGTSNSQEDININEEIRKRLLTAIKTFPTVWETPIYTDFDGEWETIQQEVLKTTDELVEVKELKAIFSHSKTNMKEKLKTLIVGRRLKKAQIEKEIKKIEFFNYFGYYRKVIKDYEKELWKEQEKDTVAARKENRDPVEEETEPISDSNMVFRETRKTLLVLLEKYPKLWEKMDDTRSNEWKGLAKELFQTTKVSVTPSLIRGIVISTRNILLDNIETHISMTNSSEEVERRLENWIYYPSFRYYRTVTKKFEEKLWKRKRGGMVEDMEVNKDEGEEETRMEVEEDAQVDRVQEITEEVEQEVEEEVAKQAEPSEPAEPAIDQVDVSQESDHSFETIEDLNFLEYDDGDENIVTRPIAIVTVSRNQKVRQKSGKIRVVKEYQPTIPELCQEAIRAEANGSLKLPRTYPGVPTKKFSSVDIEKFGSDESNTWPVQVVLEDPDDRKMWYVYFEGWEMPYRYSESYLKETATYTLKLGKVRRLFLEKIKGVPKETVEAYRQRASTHVAGSLFFDFEDLGYFHSKINEEYGLGPIIYISLNMKIRPPVYNFTAINVMSATVFNHCIARKANKPFAELGELKPQKVTVTKVGGCENPTGCVCDKRYDLVYERNLVQYMQTDASGLLDFSEFNPDHRAISIECSDACGCTLDCPRRQMQKGQKLPLVVFHEGAKGFGLRATSKIPKGGYIGEYTGVMKFPQEGENHSYEAGLGGIDNNLVICSRTTGNLIRFMSHSCDPSAIFVVVHTRLNETDPMLPRLGVFALKDIEVGEEITITYWEQEDIEKAVKRIPCLCFTPACKGFIPA